MKELKLEYNLSFCVVRVHLLCISLDRCTDGNLGQAVPALLSRSSDEYWSHSCGEQLWNCSNNLKSGPSLLLWTLHHPQSLSQHEVCHSIKKLQYNGVDMAPHWHRKELNHQTVSETEGKCYDFKFDMASRLIYFKLYSDDSDRKIIISVEQVRIW